MTSNLPTLEQNNIFVILGFARSGTSVITRGLKTLGIDLGNHITEHKSNNRWNPTGFFEDEQVIYHINAAVYKILGHPIRAIPIISHEEFTSHDFSELYAHTTQLLEKRFSHSKNWGFKNPSTAKIIPFWKTVIDKNKLNDHYIIALRNPLSSAHSFSQLTHVDLEAALILWLTHIIPAINETFGRKRIVVDYELLMQDPIKQLLRMKSQLNVHTPHEDLDYYSKEFLNKTLQHNCFSQQDLLNHPAMQAIPLCYKVYELLIKTARDELHLDSLEFSAAWQEIQNEFEKLYPVYCFIDNILKRNKALKLQIHKIEKSVIWKLLYPLRWADDALRSARVKKRPKKRLLTAYE